MTTKFYDIKAISPITKRETTFREVPGYHLRQNDSGELLFRYNHHFDSVEVITATFVPEAQMEAMENYCDKFGTRNFRFSPGQPDC